VRQAEVGPNILRARVQLLARRLQLTANRTPRTHLPFGLQGGLLRRPAQAGCLSVGCGGDVS
jgi:hypothetical protein